MGSQGSIRKYERVISLLLYLSGRTVPATKADIEANIEDYEGLSTGDEAADKSFRRDIEVLVEMGIFLDTNTPEETYLIDVDKTFSYDIALTPASLLTLRLASIAPLDDPSFVYGDDLRSALIKLAGVLPPSDKDLDTVPTSSRDDTVQNEHALVRDFENARIRHKAVSFLYTKPDGRSSHRNVEPLGLFSLKADWYLVGRDSDAQAIRSFRVDRISQFAQNNRRATPDFSPVDIDICDYVQFPFAFGDDLPFSAMFLIPLYLLDNPAFPRRKSTLYEVAGLDNHLLMIAEARSITLAARWAAEYGSTVIPVAPPELVAAYHRLLDGSEASRD